MRTKLNNRNGMRTKLSGVLCGVALCLSGMQALAAITNFSTDVATSIDMGLAWLNSVGAYNNPSGKRRRPGAHEQRGELHTGEPRAR